MSSSSTQGEGGRVWECGEGTKVSLVVEFFSNERNGIESKTIAFEEIREYFSASIDDDRSSSFTSIP